MRFPSLFKTAKHHRYNYEPRYYDPIKEEIHEKLRLARLQKGKGDVPSYHSNISAAFQKRQKKNSNASAIQLLLAIAMMGTFTAWIFYGNQVFYAFLLLTPIYFYWRLKNKGSKN